MSERLSFKLFYHSQRVLNELNDVATRLLVGPARNKVLRDFDNLRGLEDQLHKHVEKEIRQAKLAALGRTVDYREVTHERP